MDLWLGAVVPVALMALIHDGARLVTLDDGAGGWLLAFLLYDLAWYVDHRLAHRTGLFWSMHQVHHSSNQYDMTVASRGFLVDKTLLSRPTFYLLPAGRGLRAVGQGVVGRGLHGSARGRSPRWAPRWAAARSRQGRRPRPRPGG